jgi:hypothetical protein
MKPTGGDLFNQLWSTKTSWNKYRVNIRKVSVLSYVSDLHQIEKSDAWHATPSPDSVHIVSSPARAFIHCALAFSRREDAGKFSHG